jgi:hypothetical protein
LNSNLGSFQLKTMFRGRIDWWMWMRTLARGIFFTQRRVSAYAPSGMRRLPRWDWKGDNRDPRTFFGILPWCHLRSLCWFYKTMMYGCVLIPDQISSRMTHLLVLFSTLGMRYRVFCSSWMSAKVMWALMMAYRLLFYLFNRSLSTCVFPDRWKLSYVTSIFKKGRRNNVEDYRGWAIWSAILKRWFI